MPSLPALKLGAAALLTLGAADLAWINLALGPQVLDDRAEVKVEVGKVGIAKPDSASSDGARADSSKAGSSSTTKIAKADRATTDIASPKPAAAARGAVTPIYFETSSRRIGSTARATLASIAGRAGAHGIVHLEGHTDVRGADAYNEELCKRRVDNTAAVLIKQGFEASRIVRAYVGKRGAGELAETELWRDRRVDVWIEGGTE